MTPAQDTTFNSSLLANGSTANDVPPIEADAQFHESEPQSYDIHAGQIAVSSLGNSAHIESHIEPNESHIIPTTCTQPSQSTVQPESHHNISLTNELSHSFQMIPSPSGPAMAELAESNARLMTELANLKYQNDCLSHSLNSVNANNQELSRITSKQVAEITELRAALEKVTITNDVTHQLQQELGSHMRTVNVLVGEKTELVGKLQSKEQSIKEYDAQVMELQGRLKASRFRVAELEKDINTMAQLKQTKPSENTSVLVAQLDQLTEENKRLQKLYQDVSDDNTESHHQLASKTKEIDSMKNAMSSKNTELEMLRIRLQQLTDVDAQKVDDQLQQLGEQRESETERQVIELQNMISEITNDRDRIEQQYKTYVKHLTDESATMTQRIDELSRQNEKLARREESLVDHTRDLEKQIQKQISTQQRLAALKDEQVKAQPNVTGENAHNIDETVKALHIKLDECEKAKAKLHVSKCNLIQCCEKLGGAIKEGSQRAFSEGGNRSHCHLLVLNLTRNAMIHVAAWRVN